MKDSWRHYFRRIAAACIVSGAATWSSAMCYAVQLAYDTATNAAYSDGWQAADNGGFGFGTWDFAGTSSNLVYNAGPTHSVDDGLKSGTQTSSPYNDLGRAWTMYNPSGRAAGTPNGATGTDIARAGRSFSPLQIGQTLTVVVDNPIERFFYRGFNVKLNNGPGNVCYNGAACRSGQSPVNIWGVGTFEYFTYGQWGSTSLFDTDTDAGVRISFTLTGPSATDYSFTMTPLDNPSIAYSASGTLSSSAPINWIEFQFYNTDSDFFPTIIPGAAVPGDYNNNSKVDAADYVLWRKGGTLVNEVADPGTISAADYSEWRARYGNASVGDVKATDYYIRSLEITTAGSGSGIEVGRIPEPSAFVLIVAGATGLVSLRAHRKERLER